MRRSGVREGKARGFDPEVVAGHAAAVQCVAFAPEEMFALTHTVIYT